MPICDGKRKSFAADGNVNTSAPYDGNKVAGYMLQCTLTKSCFDLAQSNAVQQHDGPAGPKELHIPCRDRIDHVMSQCNYRSYSLDCAITSDEDFFRTIEEKCFERVYERYQHELKDHFDVKCFDVKKQFTTYARHMSQYLERKRFQSVPFIPRLSNRPRNRTKECIWSRPDLREKLEKYLLENVPYYQFCEDCMGSDNDLTSSTKGGTRKGRIGKGKAGEEESIFTWEKEGLGEAPTSKLYRLNWNQLPAEAKEKAELLGYSEKTWNSDADIPI